MSLDTVAEHLLDWSDQHGRHNLPWRKQGITPYEVWVSEIMLQQTQVSRVISYYERFLERFPTIESLARATWEEFLPYYAGLGYYQRGRNMLKTARSVVEKHGGVFPRDEGELRALPGVGPYTAKAILSFGYGQSHLAFDTNQQRVFGRLLHGDKKAELQVEKLEQALPPQLNYQVFNGAVMDFANLVCTKNPHCEECPLRSECRYWQTKGELEEKNTMLKQNFPLQQAQVWLFLHQAHREYYSATTDRYEPFRLPVSLTSRAQIKEYFRRQYNLELSVRPPHRQGFIEEQPVLFVNAQVLLGEIQFSAFSKQEIKQQLAKFSKQLASE